MCPGPGASPRPAGGASARAPVTLLLVLWSGAAAGSLHVVSGSAPKVLWGLMYAAGAATILVGLAWILIPAIGHPIFG